MQGFWSGRSDSNRIDKNEGKTTKIIFQENGVLTRTLSFLSFGELFLKGWRMVKNQKKPLVAASRDELLCVALPVIHRLFGVFILQKEKQVLG